MTALQLSTNRPQSRQIEPGNITRTKALRLNTPLAIYLDVDFVIESSEVTLVPEYHEKISNGELSEEAIQTLLRERNNIAKEYNIVLLVRK